MDGGLKEKKMNINIEIKGQQAHIVNQQSLISGTSNLEEIKFDFSSEWDGYTKTAVIYVDDYSISDSVKVLVEKDVVSAEKLPDWLFREECELYIGVFGDNSEGRRITSTIVCQKVKKGVPVDVVNEITPDIYNQIIKIMCDTKALVKEATDKVEINGEYLEKASEKATDAENSANKAKEYLNATENNKLEVEKLTEAKMNDIDSIVNAKIGDINALVEAKNKGIDSLVEAKSNDIATLTTAKMEDIANVTNAKLGDINNTARAQIEAINSSAAAAGESQREGINTVASNQISNITNVTNQQLENINTAATNQIGTIEGKTYIQIKNINDTALTQIYAVNKTSQSQVQNMTVKYSDMCRTLGIEHEGILCLGNLRQVSINVASFKYIKFGKMYIDSTDKKLISNQGPYLFNVDNFGYINTDEEYDISSEKELSCHSEYYHDPELTVYVDYKLYNESEETTEE